MKENAHMHAGKRDDYEHDEDKPRRSHGVAEGSEDELDEAGRFASTPSQRKPRRVGQRGQGEQSPTQDLRTTRRKPEDEEEGEEEEERSVAEGHFAGSGTEDALSTDDLFKLMDAGYGSDDLRGLNYSNITPEMAEILGREGMEEGGAAARQGNEEKDQGRNRMHADRVHESLEEQRIRAAVRQALQSHNIDKK